MPRRLSPSERASSSPARAGGVDGGATAGREEAARDADAADEQRAGSLNQRRDRARASALSGEPRGETPRFPSSRRQRADAAAKLARTPRGSAGGRGARAAAEPTPIERALRLFSSRDRTAHELEQALARAKVDPAGRAAALARMRELGYIDDAALAQSRARRLIDKGDSPRMAARRLQQQGIPAESAGAAARQAAEGASEDELASRALAQRLRGRPIRDEREKRRLLRALVQHGHRPAAAAKALKLTMDGAEESGDADVDGE